MRSSKPGPKTDPVRAENARLRTRVVEREGELATAEELIDAQGEVSALLQNRRTQIELSRRATTRQYAPCPRRRARDERARPAL